MRFVRPVILATVVAGIALAMVSGWSFASQPTAQVGSGYGAPQALPDQVINGQHASSHFGLWIGVVIALLILALAGFFGWKKSHSSEYV